jgi:uncharacterized protein YegL
MNTNLTEIIVVIDKSGSMASYRNSTIEGINKFLKDQREAPGEAKVTIVLFDTKTKVLVNGKDINDVRDLTTDSYFPDGGTALYDALGSTMAKVGERLAKTPEENRPGRVLVAVLTDGEENSSKEYNRKAVFDAIKVQEQTYSWTFIFLAAGMGAFGEAQNLGIPKGSTVAFANSVSNIGAAYGTLSMMTKAYRSTGVDHLQEFSRGMNLTASYVSNGGADVLDESASLGAQTLGGLGQAGGGIDWGKMTTGIVTLDPDTQKSWTTAGLATDLISRGISAIVADADVQGQTLADMLAKVNAVKVGNTTGAP